MDWDRKGTHAGGTGRWGEFADCALRHVRLATQWVFPALDPAIPFIIVVLPIVMLRLIPTSNMVTTMAMMLGFTLGSTPTWVRATLHYGINIIIFFLAFGASLRPGPPAPTWGKRLRNALLCAVLGMAALTIFFRQVTAYEGLDVLLLGNANRAIANQPFLGLLPLALAALCGCFAIGDSLGSKGSRVQSVRSSLKVRGCRPMLATKCCGARKT
jgi:hypothetical protein